MNPYSFVSLTTAIIMIVALITRQGEILILLLPLILRFLPSGGSKDLQISVKRKILEKRVKNHGETDVEVEIVIKGGSPGRLRLTEELPNTLELVGGKTDLFFSYGKSLNRTMKYRVRCKRGRHSLGSVRIVYWNHLGLSKKEYLYNEEDEIISLPDPFKMGTFPINVRKTLVYAGLNPSGQGGDGIYFHDVREFRTGDSLRHIHWSAVARNPSKLFTKEFEQEKVSDLGIILDSRADSYSQYGVKEDLEKGIEAASALSDLLLGLQNRVGLLIYGNYLNWTPPGYGKMQSERIRRALAVTETGDHEVFKELDNLPTNLFPEKSQLIFVSPLIKEDAYILKKLRGRGYQIMVIVLDSLGKTDMKKDPLAVDLARLERQLIMRELERYGITLLHWNLTDSIDGLIQRNKGKLQMALRGRF